MITGYRIGLAGKQSLAAFALALAFSIVIILIADLDRHDQQLFKISQNVIVNIADKLNTTNPR